MKWTVILLAVSFGSFTSQARADWADPGAAYMCDSPAKRFSMKSVMNTSEPDSGTVHADPGYSPIETSANLQCDVGAMKIRAHIEVEEPRSSGTCAGFTHTLIRSLRVNDVELFRSTAFNSSCFDGPALYEIEIQENGDNIRVESCYATWQSGVGYKRTSCDENNVAIAEAAGARTLCDRSETVAFSCLATGPAVTDDPDHPRPTPRKIISLCASPGITRFVGGRLTYRFGTGRQHMELVYPDDERTAWQAFTSHFYSSEEVSGAEVSFKQGKFLYTVYDRAAVDGEVARDIGGGVIVTRDGQPVADIQCDAHEQASDVLERMRRVIEPLDLPETPGREPR